jgi:hypothetical protein
MGSSPYRPGYDLGGFDLLLSQPIGDAADFLDPPADQLFWRSLSIQTFVFGGVGRLA